MDVDENPILYCVSETGGGARETYDALRSLRAKAASVLGDPVTFEVMKPPLILCSDGNTYSLRTLQDVFRCSGELRSPFTGEILRREAVRNLRLESLIHSLHLIVDEHDDSHDAGERDERGGDEGNDPLSFHVNLVRDVWRRQTHGEENKVGEVYDLRLPTTRLDSERGVAFLTLTDLGSQESIRLRSRVCKGDNETLDIRTPLPCESLRIPLASVAREFGVANSMEHPEKIGTMVLVGKQRDTIESRILRSLMEYEDDALVRNAWDTFCSGVGTSDCEIHTATQHDDWSEA